MRAILRIGLAVAALVAVAAIVTTATAQPRLTPEQEKQRAEKRTEIRVTDEMVRHSRIRDILYTLYILDSRHSLAGLLRSLRSRRRLASRHRSLGNPGSLGSLGNPDSPHTRNLPLRDLCLPCQRRRTWPN